MFHGGTNFGFMAGANRIPSRPFYAPDVTSYGTLKPNVIQYLQIFKKLCLA